MPQKVVFTVDAKHAGAIQKFLQFQRVLDGAGTKMDNLGRKGARTSRKMSGEMGNFAKQTFRATMMFAGFGQALGAIAGIVSVIRREYDFMKQRKLTAGAIAETADVGLSKLRASFGDPEPGAKIPTAAAWEDKMLKEIVATGLIPDIGRAGAISAAAISSSGQMVKKKKLFQNVKTMANVLGPNLSEEDAMFMAVGLGALQQKEEELTSRAAMGKYVHLFRFAPQPDFGTIARNVMPGMAAMMGMGASSEVAASLMTAIGQGAVDIQGRKTASAVIGLGKWSKTMKMVAGRRYEPIKQMSFNEYLTSVFRLQKDYPLKEDPKAERHFQMARIRYMGNLYGGEPGRMSGSQIAADKARSARYYKAVPEMSFEKKTAIPHAAIADIGRTLITKGRHPHDMIDKVLKAGMSLSQDAYEKLANELIIDIQSQPARQALNVGKTMAGTAQVAAYKRPGEMMAGQILMNLEGFMQQLKSGWMETQWETLKVTLKDIRSPEQGRRMMRDLATRQINALGRKQYKRFEEQQFRRRLIERGGGFLHGATEEETIANVRRGFPLRPGLTADEKANMELLNRFKYQLFQQTEMERKGKKQRKEKAAELLQGATGAGEGAPGAGEGAFLSSPQFNQRLLESLDRNSGVLKQVAMAVANMRLNIEIDDKAGSPLHQISEPVVPFDDVREVV
jgi:hypothetical protein